MGSMAVREPTRRQDAPAPDPARRQGPQSVLALQPLIGNRAVARLVTDQRVLARAPGTQAPPFSVGPDDIQNIAGALQRLVNSLDPNTVRNLTRNKTVALGLVTDSAGHPTLVYTVSNNWTNADLTKKAQEQGITRWEAQPRAGERGPQGAPADAEQLLLEAAGVHDFDVHAVAVTRPVCPDCGLALDAHRPGGVPRTVVVVPRPSDPPPAKGQKSNKKAKAPTAKAKAPKPKPKPKPAPPAELPENSVFRQNPLGPTILDHPQPVLPKDSVFNIKPPPAKPRVPIAAKPRTLDAGLVEDIAARRGARIRRQGGFATIGGMAFTVMVIGTTWMLVDSIRANGVLQTAKDIAIQEALTRVAMRYGKVGFGMATLAVALLGMESDNVRHNEAMRNARITNDLIYDAFPGVLNKYRYCTWPFDWPCTGWDYEAIDDKRYLELFDPVLRLVENPWRIDD